MRCTLHFGCKSIALDGRRDPSRLALFSPSSILVQCHMSHILHNPAHWGGPFQLPQDEHGEHRNTHAHASGPW
jgi:hypothetical protein